MKASHLLARLVLVLIASLLLALPAAADINTSKYASSAFMTETSAFLKRMAFAAA